MNLYLISYVSTLLFQSKIIIKSIEKWKYLVQMNLENKIEVSITVVIQNRSMKNWENYYFIYLEEG